MYDRDNYHGLGLRYQQISTEAKVCVTTSWNSLRFSLNNIFKGFSLAVEQL